MFNCRFSQEILRESVMSKWMNSENHSCTLTGQKTSDWSQRSSRLVLSRLATASGMISRYHSKLSVQSCWFDTLVHILVSPTLFCFKHTFNYIWFEDLLDCIKVMVWIIYRWWLENSILFSGGSTMVMTGAASLGGDPPLGFSACQLIFG